MLIKRFTSFRSPLLGLGQIVLLVISALPIFYMRNKSITTDEVVHLPAGYSYFVRKSIGYNPQHPPLIKEICAVPLLFMNVKRPSEFPQDEWTFGQQFLFSQDAQRLLFWARVPVVLMSFGLAWLVMAWAGKLWGGGAAVMALFFYAFDPTITAHAQLVTTDVGLAFFSTLYLFQLRSCLIDPSRKRWACAGVFLGLALGTKFSAVILIPITLVLLLLASRKTENSTSSLVSELSHGLLKASDKPWGNPRVIIARLAMICAGLLVLACLVLWVLYFFPADPLVYWKGLKAVNQDHQNFHAYLLGTIKQGGWKSYLLIAWVVKTPLPFLILLGSAIVPFLAKRQKFGLEEAFLLLPAVGYFCVYSLFADNLGVRYLIPCFPFLFIFTSRISGEFLRGSRLFIVAIVGLLVWYSAEYVMITPDHLSYFNEIAGGPKGGVKWLDDSNVDWGQGLIQLQDYLRTNAIRDYQFFYFGMGDPIYYGILGNRIWDSKFFLGPSPGLYILSAHRVARGHAILKLAYGESSRNWLLHRPPRAVIGHAYYVYEF